MIRVNQNQYRYNRNENPLLFFLCDKNSSPLTNLCSRQSNEFLPASQQWMISKNIEKPKRRIFVRWVIKSFRHAHFIFHICKLNVKGESKEKLSCKQKV